MRTPTTLLAVLLFASCAVDVDAPESTPDARSNASAGALGASASPAPAPADDGDDEHIVWFGQLEVRSGALKSALGRPPHKGEHVTLRFFAPEVARFVEGPYALATNSHLFVRFRGSDTFGEATGMPSGTYLQRGPMVAWSADYGDVDLAVPADADRIEVYAYFDRTSWNGGTCYMGYDMSECPDTIAIAGDWVSNYGANFRIGVE